MVTGVNSSLAWTKWSYSSFDVFFLTDSPVMISLKHSIEKENDLHQSKTVPTLNAHDQEPGMCMALSMLTQLTRRRNVRVNYCSSVSGFDWKIIPVVRKCDWRIKQRRKSTTSFIWQNWHRHSVMLNKELWDSVRTWQTFDIQQNIGYCDDPNNLQPAHTMTRCHVSQSRKLK